LKIDYIPSAFDIHYSIFAFLQTPQSRNLFFDQTIRLSKTKGQLKQAIEVGA